MPDQKGKNKMAKNTRRAIGAAPAVLELLDPDELKALVHDGLVSIELTERENFIWTLEAEMRRAKLNMRDYLVPPGIPGRNAADLTPNKSAILLDFSK